MVHGLTLDDLDVSVMLIELQIHYHHNHHHHHHHIRLLNFVRTQSNIMRDIETIQTNTRLYKSYGQ